MNANPKFLSATATVDEAAIAPLPNSRKIYVEGSRPDIRVPMREISQADTPTGFGGEKNPPIFVYDCSGPYTDPQAKIDIRSGLPALRQRWIEERGDTEVLPDLTSEFGRQRAADPSLDELRFPGLHRKPRRAKAGANVSQMHYARQGIITPEMEFVAIRENNNRRAYVEQLKASGEQGERFAEILCRQHPGHSFGASIPDEITPELLQTCLVTGDLPLPDLCIRTGGEHRISNFLLWQCAYSEFVFMDVLWPDFDAGHLERALAEFSQEKAVKGLKSQGNFCLHFLCESRILKTRVGESGVSYHENGLLSHISIRSDAARLFPK